MIDKDNLPSQTEPADIAEKVKRVREFMASQRCDAVLIGRADNFAWLTCGGNNKVVKSWETGFGFLLITPDAVKLIAQVMDGPRIRDDELQGMAVEYVPLHWYEPSKEDTVAALTKGKKVLADCPIPGATVAPGLLYALHYPLTDKEIARLKWLGARSDAILRQVADSVTPGMREVEVANRLQAEYALSGIDGDVLLVGSDERTARYRHPNPSDKPVDKWLLLHPAVQKWGLHANVTRHVSFGEPAAEIRKKYDTACRVHATALSMCEPGTRFSDILAAQKETYKACGFEEEWRLHFQGGITGYLLADPTLCTAPQNEVRMNMAYDWFITVTGVKSEELSINTRAGVETPSLAGNWPTTPYDANGKTFAMPEILVR
ncbi:MAG: M24 family metallopeptidase [Kiritimatiellae bacterium]|nr:M24 family metallopeptidase [Kiritimatiellia bacterium]